MKPRAACCVVCPRSSPRIPSLQPLCSRQSQMRWHGLLRRDHQDRQKVPDNPRQLHGRLKRSICGGSSPPRLYILSAARQALHVSCSSAFGPGRLAATRPGNDWDVRWIVSHRGASRDPSLRSSRPPRSLFRSCCAGARRGLAKPGGTSSW